MVLPLKNIFFIGQKNSEQTAELDFTYYNAVYTVENALAKVKDEKGMSGLRNFSSKKSVLIATAPA